MSPFVCTLWRSTRVSYTLTSLFLTYSVPGPNPTTEVFSWKAHNKIEGPERARTAEMLLY